MLDKSNYYQKTTLKYVLQDKNQEPAPGTSIRDSDNIRQL
ncbi:hypothetical protein SAMN05421820_102183 [Pedobacter steynii]|uniref:Uncharacterized protein n=1 Tax=Pedobacter steynii TaxID=430522 RepID=A0A1G9N107_9SPHI|nr:hypothetical protein SAMN05421820_102183 [Pedobacter steynii]